MESIEFMSNFSTQEKLLFFMHETLKKTNSKLDEISKRLEKLEQKESNVVVDKALPKKETPKKNTKKKEG